MHRSKTRGCIILGSCCWWFYPEQSAAKEKLTMGSRTVDTGVLGNSSHPGVFCVCPFGCFVGGNLYITPQRRLILCCYFNLCHVFFCILLSRKTWPGKAVILQPPSRMFFLLPFYRACSCRTQSPLLSIALSSVQGPKDNRIIEILKEQHYSHYMWDHPFPKEVLCLVSLCSQEVQRPNLAPWY